MSRRILLGSCFGLLFAMLIGLQSASAIRMTASEPAEWKLPLPAGDWLISQGPRDTIDCTNDWSSHCSASSWNACAVDLVKVLGQNAPNKDLPVLAPADGTVIKAGFDATGGGNYVQIEHGAGGRVSLYLHLDSPAYSSATLSQYLQENNGAFPTVRQGSVIGYTGWGGDSRTGGYHLHFDVLADRSSTACVSMAGIDGNTDLARGQRVKSTNRQEGVLSPPASSPVTPAPAVSPPRTAAAGSPDPWDVSWLPGDRNQVIAAINSIIVDPSAGGSPSAGLKGYGETILNYSLASISGNPAGVNPAFALAMFDKEANFATNGAAPVNNNPGNIICLNGTRPLYGATRCNGRFSVFNSMADGIKGYFWLLQYEYKPGGGSSRNCPDIPCIIRAYAPSSENDTNLYISQVTDWTHTFQNRISNGAPVEPPQPPTPQPAARPTLSNPGNGSSLAPNTDVTLSWNASSNAAQYKVELWGGPYGTMVPCDWQGGTSCHIGQMRPGTMQWHVKARNASGQESDWSDTWSFTIQAPATPAALPTNTPAPPPPSAGRLTLSSPGNGAAMPQATDVTLSWNAASNATQYKVELWGGPYSTMVPCDWQAGTSCHIGQMWPGTMQWHVKARNASAQETDWSDTWSFTIQAPPTNTPPPPPQSASRPSLSRPGNGAAMPQTTNVTLSWNTSSNATQYKVELWGGPYTTMVPCDWQSGQSCHIGQMWAGVMQWHVKARSSSGQESDWSDTWSFTIEAPAEPATPVPPPKPAGPSGNLAPSAQRVPDGIASGNAFDGNLSTFWTNGLGHAFNLRLTLTGSAPVNRIIVWDRPQNSPDNNQINALIISLSNGWSKRFDMNSGGPRCIDVSLSSAPTINWVNLKADDASGNNGLSEVEIWSGNKITSISCSNKGNMP